MKKNVVRLLLIVVSFTFMTSLVTLRTTLLVASRSEKEHFHSKSVPENVPVRNEVHRVMTTPPLPPLSRFITNRKNSNLQGLKLEMEAEFFKHARILGKPRSKPALFTIGIPTMKRPQTYFWQTMSSLLKNCNDAEKAELVFVIMLSDFEPEHRKNISDNIMKTYKSELESGLIQVIEAPRRFYPRLQNLKRTYNQPMQRVIWRAKQNIDFAFMMKYSQNLSKFYLQLEDDVSTVPNYIFKMKKFISQWKHWVCLEFSTLGFIAKLYHNSDLQKLADMLTLFYEEQPNDVTYLSFNRLMMQGGRRISNPTLFQHHGYHSTLTIKKNTWKDERFKNATT